MSTATDMLAEYLAAESLVLKGKEATIGDRRFRFEDLAAIREGRKEWQAKVDAEAAGGDNSPRIGGLAFKVARLDGNG
jgi:hypothetical protein